MPKACLPPQSANLGYWYVTETVVVDGEPQPVSVPDVDWRAWYGEVDGIVYAVILTTEIADIPNLLSPSVDVVLAKAGCNRKPFTEKKLHAIKKRWNRQNTRSAPEYLNDWHTTDDCILTQWCKEQGNISFVELVDRFNAHWAGQGQHFYLALYDLGFLMGDDIRQEWLNEVCKSPVAAFWLYVQDTTLATEEEQQLEDAFRLSERTCVNLIAALDAGEIVPVQRGGEINMKSDTVKGLLHG